jgi:hypothetical protein
METVRRAASQTRPRLRNLGAVCPGELVRARADLTKLARANRLNQWQFNEWLHGQTASPSGMPHQSWTAAAFLIAQRALTRAIFDVASKATPGANPERARVAVVADK